MSIVVNSSEFPKPVLQLLKTDKVRVEERGGVISLIPVFDVDGAKRVCPLLGLTEGSGLTVERFLAMKRADKELE